MKKRVIFTLLPIVIGIILMISYQRVLDRKRADRDALLANMTAEWNAHLITKNIYLGSMAASLDKERLKKEGITHILSIGASLHPRSYPEDFDYMYIDAFDVPFENVHTLFPIATKFIEDALQRGGKVLVHCKAGVSRSATLVIAYMMKQNGLSAEENIKNLQKIRPVIDPNPGFRKQLKHYEEILKNPTVNAVYESEFHILNLLGKLISAQDCPKGATECTYVHGNVYHTIATNLYILLYKTQFTLFQDLLTFAQQI
eukprot:TRINITY_DN7286_c0_g1_i1.p1 TRINITY_DN7286_c0_g1~~TRINITY_DN7286_c0_g1_i1.p1  ORF type:complete len:258 (+),score=17.95 TRINITY_DN7286_c0_g1_i1:110-883(+)